MSTIDTRSAFFPHKNTTSKAESTRHEGQVDGVKRNSLERASEITEKTAADAQVSIGDGIKDFSKIKKAAMAAPEVDNTDKIARLKAQIAAGTYQVDYDALADKILGTEF